MFFHTTRDILFMRHCIDLAWSAQTLTLPNPPVGAILLDSSYEIISKAIHLKAGRAHAEVLALLYGYEVLSGKKSGLDKSNDSQEIHDFLAKNHNGLFRDKILLITLEPCNHYGKTPPCAELIATLKPAKVIIGFCDKWGESSNGAKRLQKAGVEVEFLSQEILPDFSYDNIYAQMLDLLYPFLCLKDRGRFNLFKLALRLDGEYKDGQISGTASRIFTHNQRCIAQNLIISGRTALSDKPRLDTRYADSFYAKDVDRGFKLSDFEMLDSLRQDTPQVQTATQNLSSQIPQISQRLPNIEILTRNKESLLQQSKTIPLFSLPNRNVAIKTSPNELSLSSGFNIIEGGFSLLQTLRDKVDMLLLHISPSVWLGDFSHLGRESKHIKNTKNAQNIKEMRGDLAKILCHFRILHSDILDENLLSKNELFIQKYSSKSQKSVNQNLKTSKIDSRQNVACEKVCENIAQNLGRTQDLLLWLKPINF